MSTVIHSLAEANRAGHRRELQMAVALGQAGRNLPSFGGTEVASDPCTNPLEPALEAEHHTEPLSVEVVQEAQAEGGQQEGHEGHEDVATSPAGDGCEEVSEEAEHVGHEEVAEDLGHEEVAEESEHGGHGKGPGRRLYQKTKVPEQKEDK